MAGDGTPLKNLANYEDERRQAKFAITEIHTAETAVNEAKRNKMEVDAAVKMLEEAKAGYDANDYQRAVELSLQVKRAVYDLMMAKK